jgi:hypothetical protein
VKAIVKSRGVLDFGGWLEYYVSEYGWQHNREAEMTREQLKIMTDLILSPAAYTIRLAGVAAIVGADHAEKIIDGAERIVMRHWRAVGATAGRRLVEDYIGSKIESLLLETSP